MNTTRLIRNWSMEGALEELQRRDAPSADDVAAAAAGEGERRDDSDATAPESDVMVKPAGEDDWRPLVLDG